MENLNDTLILAAIFVAVLMTVFALLSAIRRQRDISRNIEGARGGGRGAASRTDRRIDEMLGSHNEYIQHYFDVIRKERPDSIESRLIRAGFFGKRALFYFNLARLAVAAVVFVAVWLIIRTFFLTVSAGMATIVAMIASGVGFILVNAVLDRMGTNKQVAYRKLFPDFMDLLIVCVDAGLSIEAAIDRVAREFMQTTRDFGIHLGIIGLEVRAGRPMHEALTHFADRVNVEEARSLATLFRQSEELGSSVSKTLRVFSSEMRQRRLVRAEEKANALPIKMLFPMALFLFPVSLIIVLVPIVMTILRMFLSLGGPPSL